MCIRDSSCPSGDRVIDLRVQPIPGEQEDDKELTAVLFLENRLKDGKGVQEKYDVDATAARRIAELEREFQVSQSDLRSTIQRLETVNGELQAANEELLTANEAVSYTHLDVYKRQVLLNQASHTCRHAAQSGVPLLPGQRPVQLLRARRNLSIRARQLRFVQIPFIALRLSLIHILVVSSSSFSWCSVLTV